MRKLKNILRSRYLFKILFIICLVYIFLFIKLDKKESVYNLNDNEFTGIITSYKYEKDKYTIYLECSETIVVNYKTDSVLDLKYGDTITVRGTLSKPNNNTIPNLFNYKKYLERRKIYYVLKADNIEKIKNNENIIYDIKNSLIERINKIEKSSSYILAFVLGIKSDIDEEVNTSYQENGVSHLFAISGMHISLFSSLLYFLIKKISYNNYYNFLVVLIFLIFYMILLDSPISVVRTIVMFIIFKINKLFNLQIKQLDLMLIVFMIITFNNPYIIYEVSFQFSYLISFYLIIFNKKINKAKYKKLYMSFVCFIVSLPIILYNYYQASFLSIILNLFFIPYVSMIIFPLSVLTLIFPILDSILYIFITILENISLFFANLDIFKIVFARPSIYLVIFYYFVITISIYNNKFLGVLFLVLLLHKNYIYFDNKLRVTFLDVSQGDSILITYKDNTILIDTGGSYYYTDMSLSKTIPYLKSLGRTRVDYLILTHGDYDHMGEAINIVKNIKVKNVIFNKDEYNDLENELIEVLEEKKIKYYKEIEYLDIDNIRLLFLNNKLYDNENDNSNIIYFSYNNYSFLLTGDISSRVEYDLIEKYNLNDIDFFKVSHHGSSTSSSKYFIDNINIKNSIISVGKNNIYNHPSSIVIDNLANTNIYRTDIDGSIEINIKNRCTINTYPA